ncbi:MAG: response regulator [Deltaproteobacteria bacterium]|nr:response regulator [Deltaproteobacteria bacterium]
MPWHGGCSVFTPGVSFVAKSCKILIADRNRHVRDFLRRELSAEGYQVEVARDGREVLERINGEDPPHLLILDLDIPYLEEPEVWAGLKDRKPSLPVVIHTFLPEYPTNLTLPIAATFLEKKGDTDLLKMVVAEVLEKHYPGGVPAREKTG